MALTVLYEDRVRAKEIEKAVALGSPRASSVPLFRLLSSKQKLYCAKLIQFKGDWKRAAVAAGYSEKTTRRQIEDSDAIRAYLVAIQAEISIEEGVASAQVIAGLYRNALAAAAAGDYGASNRAWKLLGDAMGMFKLSAPEVNFNQNGVIIQIAATPVLDAAEDAESLPATYREVLALNGREVEAGV
jgi:hypothetical protein